MAKKVQKKNKFIMAMYATFALIIGFCGGFSIYGYFTLPKSDVYIGDDLKIHFFDMGTKTHGDCIYIQVGDVDIIVDSGSEASSVQTIYNYIQPKMYDNKIEYAIVTHAHEDHIAGFAGTSSSDSLFDKFEFETIIDFPSTDQKGGSTTTYGKYIEERDGEVLSGATHYTALECWNSASGAQRIYSLGGGSELQILYNYYYENKRSDKNENEYSVCFQIKQGEKYFLFTGDLEASGETKLLENNILGQVEFYKASHHGSYTSASTDFLAVIKPKLSIVPCVAGYNQYNAKPENIYPSQTFINNIAPYTDKIYIPTLYDKNAVNDYSLLNGNIVLTSNKNGVSVSCSNNSTLLKNTNWFSANRVLPAVWEE